MPCAAWTVLPFASPDEADAPDADGAVASSEALRSDANCCWTFLTVT